MIYKLHNYLAIHLSDDLFFVLFHSMSARWAKLVGLRDGQSFKRQVRIKIFQARWRTEVELILPLKSPRIAKNDRDA